MMVGMTKPPGSWQEMSGCQFLMKSAATFHIKITVIITAAKATEEKYYLVFDAEDEGVAVAWWSGIFR